MMRWIIAVTLMLMGGGYHELAALYPVASWLQLPVVRVVFPALLLVSGLVLVALSGKIFSRDPVLFSWSVLGLVGCLLVGPLLIGKYRQQNADERAHAAVVEARKQLIVDMRRRQAMLKATEADRRERMKTDRFAQYEGRIPMDVLDALRRLDKAMQLELERHTSEYTAALQANPTKGPNSWIRSQRKEDLDAELANHIELYAKTRAFTEFVETFEDRYTASIEALHLQSPADRVATAELERILQLWESTHVYTLRKLDVSMLGEAIKALNILESAWGTWQFDPRSNQLTFQNPDQEWAFNQAVLSMRDIAKEVDSLQ